MEFGQWLNSLTWLDHNIIILIFIIASYLALLSIAGFKQIMQSAQKKNPYLGQIRTTPFLFFGFAIKVQLFAGCNFSKNLSLSLLAVQ